MPDLMSALGHKRTFRSAIAMSALPPKADIYLPSIGCLLCAKSGLMHHSNQLFDHLVVRPCAFAVLTLRGAVKSIIIEQKQQVAANQCDWPSKAKSRLPQGENKLGSKSLFRARRIHTARKTEWSTPCRFTRTASSNESCHS